MNTLDPGREGMNTLDPESLLVAVIAGVIAFTATIYFLNAL